MEAALLHGSPLPLQRQGLPPYCFVNHMSGQTIAPLREMEQNEHEKKSHESQLH